MTRSPAIRELQVGAAEAEVGIALGQAYGSDTSKWPMGPAVAGVVTASLLLWAIIIAGCISILF